MFCRNYATNFVNSTNGELPRATAIKLWTAATSGLDHYIKISPPPSQYHELLISDLKTRHVWRESVTSDVNTTRAWRHWKSSIQDPVTGAIFMYSWLFFQNFPISPTFALSPYLNSRYLKTASSKINCHVLTKLIRLPVAHNSCFNHRTESSTFTVETHLHRAFAND